MDYLVITLDYQGQQADLEIPVSVPLFTWAPIVLENLGWVYRNEADTAVQFVGHIQKSGDIIRSHETLAQVGVVDGDTLELQESLEKKQDNTIIVDPLTNRPHLKADEKLFILTSKSMLIGRDKNCPIRLPGIDVVSRRHANVVRRDDGFWINDENSTNGTIVDGYMLKGNESVRLRNGSQIQVGEDGPILFFYSGDPL